MTPHTPGPWVGGLQISARGFVVAHVQTNQPGLQGFSHGNGAPQPVAEANARLIAAAPDLLEALKRMVAQCRLAGVRLVADDLARAAIAKAVGQ